MLMATAKVNLLARHEVVTMLTLKITDGGARKVDGSYHWR
jgi:hypothetical protein